MINNNFFTHGSESSLGQILNMYKMSETLLLPTLINVRSTNSVVGYLISYVNAPSTNYIDIDYDWGLGRLSYYEN